MNYSGDAWYLAVLVAAFLGFVQWVFGDKRKVRFARDGKLPFTRPGRRHAAVDASGPLCNRKGQPTEHLPAADFHADSEHRHRQPSGIACASVRPNCKHCATMSLQSIFGGQAATRERAQHRSGNVVDRIGRFHGADRGRRPR